MTSILLHAAFVFAVLGSKLMIALWAIYYLLPGGRSCPACDAETIPLEMGLPHRLCGALFFLGKVRRRWCPECAWDGFVRRSLEPVFLQRPLTAGDPADRPI